MDLKKKVALVTGSSSGIGQATAIELAKEGAKVLIHYRKNEDGANETLKKIKKYSTGSIFKADLEDADQIKMMFEKIRKSHSKLDVLINNAGQYQPGEFHNMEVWDRQFKNILLTAVLVTDEFINMDSLEIRKVVNVSSVYGTMDFPNPEAIQYSAMKAAMSSMTVSLAKKHSPNILVNSVLPGYTLTPAWGELPKDVESRLGGESLINRFVKADEIATMIVEVVKNDALTGQLIRIDGGLGLKG